jgi:hypothetical protein
MNNIGSTASVPVWAPRVPRSKIRRLYEADALGIHDQELIDDVGYSLLARCDSFVTANEAVAGRARCPRCSSTVLRGGDKEELLRCRCGWELPWSEYFGTIQHRQLSGAEPVLGLFRDFIARFPLAHSSREKMVLIDQLLHGFHWYYKTGEPTRPVAINLIEGRLREVMAFLDSLTYGDKSTPELLESKAT